MTTLTTGTEIFLTTHKGLAMPSFFEIVKSSEKAVQLKNSNNKTVWMPKTTLKWDDKFQSFYVADWFRKKMEVWQLSILQS
jgi:hypothetical protein